MKRTMTRKEMLQARITSVLLSTCLLLWRCPAFGRKLPDRESSWDLLRKHLWRNSCFSIFQRLFFSVSPEHLFLVTEASYPLIIWITQGHHWGTLICNQTKYPKCARLVLLVPLPDTTKTFPAKLPPHTQRGPHYVEDWWRLAREREIDSEYICFIFFFS